MHVKQKLMHVSMCVLLLLFCTVSLSSDIAHDVASPQPTIARVSNERIIKAQEKYKEMAVSIDRRCMLGFVAAIAYQGIELYALLNSDYHLPLEMIRDYKKTSWMQFIKHCCVSFAKTAVKSLVLSVIHEKAQPLLSQFSEKVWIATKGHWLFEDGGQYVHLPHMVYAFITLLQVLEKSTDTLAQCSLEYEHERMQALEIINYMVVTAEKIIGYLRYSAARIASEDVVESMMIERIGNHVHLCFDHFCHDIEQIIGAHSVDKNSATTSLPALCQHFGRACKMELRLLRNLSSYQFEIA